MSQDLIMSSALHQEPIDGGLVAYSVYRGEWAALGNQLDPFDSLPTAYQDIWRKVYAVCRG